VEAAAKARPDVLITGRTNISGERMTPSIRVFLKTYAWLALAYAAYGVYRQSWKVLLSGMLEGLSLL